MSEKQLELFHLPVERRELCLDCGVDTVATGEYYMVSEELWTAAAGESDDDGMLCVGCLERRLGCRLGPGDFTDVPLNCFAGKSARLRARLLGVSGGEEYRIPRNAKDATDESRAVAPENEVGVTECCGNLHEQTPPVTLTVIPGGAGRGGGARA